MNRMYYGIRMAASIARKGVNHWVLLAVCLSAAGVLAIRWKVSSTDRILRGHLLANARSAATTIHIEHIQALSGTAADVSSPHYVRLKEQMRDFRAANAQCRFVYLLGLRPAPAGDSVIFFVDSESPDSAGYSPPGQVYTEASDVILRVFRTGDATVEGPMEDRWGVWVSALVPLRDPDTDRVVSVLGMDIDARAWQRTVLAAVVLPASMMLAALALLGVTIALLHSRGRIVSQQTALLQSEEKRRKTEETRHFLEDRFSKVFQCSPDACVLSTLPEGRIVEVNDSFTRLLGYTAEEAQGHTTDELELWADTAGRDELVKRIHRDGFVFSFETTLRAKSGGVLHVRVSSTTIRTDKRQFVQSIVTDITEHQRAEQQLRQAQKLESVARLAGGVAHEFNNLAMGIMGFADLAREQLPPDHPVQQDLAEITDGAKRTAELTRQMLAFARKQIIAPIEIDLNEVLANMVRMLRHLIGEDIDLIWLPGTDLWPVKMDPGQVDQILANLCINARDAIARIGKITIATANVTIDRAYCARHAHAMPGQYVLCTVSDDGCGMSREVIEHIFEPFYTTKGVGEGTGLGLPTVFGIVKQNKGFVHVASEPGKGTTVRVYLPRLSVAVDAAEETDIAATVERPRGSETILLVEDEASVRQTTARFLEPLGYTVLAAETPHEALRLAGEHAGTIDLLLTDVVMPGMSGRELAVTLAVTRPEMAVLYMSGYAADDIVERSALNTGTAFLGKPFSRDMLASKVREILDGGKR